MSISSRSRERIAKDMDRDFFLSAEQAKEYGLIDEIIGKTRLRRAARWRRPQAVDLTNGSTQTGEGPGTSPA